MLLFLGAAISGFALSRNLAFSGPLLVLFGFALMAVFASVSSLVQLITTDEMRGRVMSVYNCAFRGGMPLGNLISGWLVPAFTAPIVLTANGILLIGVSLYFLLIHRKIASA
jgi:predicted MFS family arabinose efflux permease